MKYSEATFKIVPDSQDARDLVSALAGEAGFESFEEAPTELRGFVQTDLLDRPLLDSLLEQFPIEGTHVSYELKDVDEKDWNATWEAEGFEPIVIGDRCIIYDAKHEDASLLEIKPGELSIGIDARQAFGTGTHETTQMMVSTLLDCNLANKRVLDCGCGTGILGIAAKKLGAGEVVGYDIDDWSVENAKHNAEINGVEMEILEGDKSVLSHVNGVFDVVLANINRNILLNDMAAFVDVMNMHATLILSGFYNEDSELLLLKAVELGLHEVDRKSEGNWCCLHLEK